MSASRDMSVRLWNLSSGECVAVFAGDAGHRDDVLTADFHSSGERIISGGVDHAVNIWSITPEIKRALALSYLPTHARTPPGMGQGGRSARPFPTVHSQHPLWSSDQVHTDYVDHIRYFGEYILSKSTEARIQMWKLRPATGSPAEKVVGNTVQPAVAASAASCADGAAGAASGAATGAGHKLVAHHLCNFEIPECDIFFMRFAIDYPCLRYLATGNRAGVIHIWSLDHINIAGAGGSPSDASASAAAAASGASSASTITAASAVIQQPSRKLSHSQSNRAIRCVAFSNDAEHLIACCEDGSIFRWDRVPDPRLERQTERYMARRRKIEAEAIERKRNETMAHVKGMRTA
jgi:polycomb protein EED